MKPTLTLTNNLYEVAPYIKVSSVPSLGEMINVQNKEKQEKHLSEDEGLFIGYGKITGCYPYKEQNQYHTQREEQEVAVAILENKYLRATFLTEYGGRLWELIDKRTGKNLLYTNDVIQPRNLAIRNAWFSGGVEWNIGAIGHSPFTCEKMYVADTVREDDTPILRMYEYERIRRVTYQMDFWLEEELDILFCRMRIDNRNDEMVPMYWWSNIAVPEYEDGRIVVPASEAYKNSVKPYIRKVTTPVDSEVNKDISFYKNTVAPVDYFFDIPDEQKKFIANVNSEGYGLLQLSSKRLRGRKLFSWGHLSGSDNWQDILTKDAGKYVEIQAGVGKTQYECVPMPPHTAWEWIECYTSLNAAPNQVLGDYDYSVQVVDTIVNNIWEDYDLDVMVTATKDTIGKKSFQLRSGGSGFGALENRLRNKMGAGPVSHHLTFSDSDPKIKDWIQLIKHGTIGEKDVKSIPQSFVLGDSWVSLLEDATEHRGRNNWYVWYQLGVMYKHQEAYAKALECFKEAILLDVNVWSYHALAYLHMDMEQPELGIKYGKKAIALGYQDYSLCESIMKLMLGNQAYEDIIESYVMLTNNLKDKGRLKMYLAYAYAKTNRVEEAASIIHGQGGLMVDDIREGEVSITELWLLVYQLQHPEVVMEDIVVPRNYDFRMQE